MAAEVRGATICALARAVATDIDTAWEAVKTAEDPRIHVFINTSDIQMAHQLNKDREQVLTQAEGDGKARGEVHQQRRVQPHGRDTRRPEVRVRDRQALRGRGHAATINIPDSVGYAIPAEIEELFKMVMENVPNIHKARLSFHGQNDLGLCTGNTLAAVSAGARQVEVTINGIGERRPGTLPSRKW
ncbi:MAG: hypothetical protein R3C29_03165 [Dehalococcoidia bacterium]